MEILPIVLTAVSTLLGTTTIGGIYYAIRFWKENKRLKVIEVQKNELEAETQELENESKKLQLGAEYLEKMKEAAELVYKSSQQSQQNWDDMKETMRLFENRLDNFEKILQQVVDNQNTANKKIENLETFENGKYQEFLRNKQAEEAESAGKKNNVKRKPKKTE